MKQVNKDYQFWVALEHDDWKLFSFVKMECGMFTRGATDANGSALPDETITITKNALQFVNRAMHFKNDGGDCLIGLNDE